MKKIRVFSICSGVGGLDMPFHDDNFELIGVCEIDKHASAVLSYRYPEVKNYGDITKIDPEKLPDFDLLVGGTPCQDLSISGSRRGLRGERSGLFYLFVEILRSKRPDYFIWENVKGVISSQNGWDFAIIETELANAGYDHRGQILSSAKFGIPQDRERVFIVGINREIGGSSVFLD